MATIGTFTRDGNAFTGIINTLALKSKAIFQPIDKSNENAPDFRVYAAGVEIGAAWSKTGQESERPYLSVKLDDPSFAQPIYGRLVELREGGHRLIWSR